MTMQRIVDVHFPSIKKQLVDDAMDIFFDVRKIPGLKKKPSTSELVDWLKLIMGYLGKATWTLQMYPQGNF